MKSDHFESRRNGIRRHVFPLLKDIALPYLLFIIGILIGRKAVAGLRSLLNVKNTSISFVMDNYMPFIIVAVLSGIIFFLVEKKLCRQLAYVKKGGQRGNTLRFVIIGMLFGFLANAICTLVACVHGDLFFSYKGFHLFYLLFAFVFVLIQSATEELLTRFFLYETIRRDYSLWLAIVVNGVFFSLVHIQNEGYSVLSGINLFLFGIFWCLFVYCYDSIWFCMISHAAWNFTQNFLLGLPNSGIVSEASVLQLEVAKESSFYNVAFGVEGGVTITVLLSVGSIVLLFLSKRSRNNEKA